MFHALARTLAARRVSPNAISMFGMACAAGAAVCLGLTEDLTVRDRLLFAGAAALIQLRLLANLLDGMVAIEGRLQSPTGELFNEVPDRISDVLVLVGAGYATGGSQVLGWLASVLALFVAYIRLVGQSLGFAPDYSGPMAKQQRMFLITAASFSMCVLPAKWLPTQSMTESSIQLQPMWLALALIIVGCAVTVARRLRKIVSALIGPSRGA